MQPTPTRSPTWWRVTSEPTSVTMPTISWPGTTGKGWGPQSPLTVWMSEWQMPAYSISMRTSLASDVATLDGGGGQGLAGGGGGVGVDAAWWFPFGAWVCSWRA